MLEFGTIATAVLVVVLVAFLVTRASADPSEIAPDVQDAINGSAAGRGTAAATSYDAIVEANLSFRVSEIPHVRNHGGRLNATFGGRGINNITWGHNRKYRWGGDF